MKLLKPAENTMAFFKCGIFGFQGTGKTYTATDLCIGIAQATGANRMAFFDTETGSDFLLGKLKAAGIEVFQVKSRSFTDCVGTIRECQSEGVPILIIDSITHVWRDLCDSYDKKLNRKGRLQFQDWAVIKAEWRDYTDAFVNSRVHIVTCGRAGYEYDYDFNEDGSKDLVKTGTKMKAEAEFGFEPSLVIEMHRVTKAADDLEKIKEEQNKYERKNKKAAYRPEIGSAWIHRAHILKDRTDTMNGKIFDYPTFEDLRPHFDALNIGGRHLGVDTSRNSEERFGADGKPDWQRRKHEAEIACEEIQGVMVHFWPSSSADEKKAKLEFLNVVFGTNSWTKVQDEKLEKLQQVVKVLPVFKAIFVSGESISTAWVEATKGPSKPEPAKPEDAPALAAALEKLADAQVVVGNEVYQRAVDAAGVRKFRTVEDCEKLLAEVNRQADLAAKEPGSEG